MKSMTNSEIKSIALEVLAHIRKHDPDEWSESKSQSFSAGFYFGVQFALLPDSFWENLETCISETNKHFVQRN